MLTTTYFLRGMSRGGFRAAQRTNRIAQHMMSTDASEVRLPGFAHRILVLMTVKLAHCSFRVKSKPSKVYA